MNDGTALDLTALRNHLQAQDIPVAGELRATPITGGRSNLTYRVFDDRSKWVLRRPPVAGLTPSAHDVGREYRVLDGLQGSGVPIAPTVLNCDDASVIGAPFTLVGFVPGRVLRTQGDLDELTLRQLVAVQEELIRVLASLHSVPYRAAGLADFGRPDGFVERQIALWRKQWDRVKTRELPAVDQLYLRLTARPPRSGSGPSVIHGDFRIDNTLLNTGRINQVVAVVDWEMATLGDPITDVAMMCAYQHPDFDHVVGEPGASTSTRWPDHRDIAQAYAAAAGTDLGDFDAYRALAFLKLAVIAEGIFSRYQAGAGSGAGFASAGLAVPGLVDAGLAALL